MKNMLLTYQKANKIPGNPLKNHLRAKLDLRMKQKGRKKSRLEQKNNKNLEKRSIQMKIELFVDKYAKSQQKE